MGEEWADCAKREVLEETGLRIHNVQFLHVTNDIMMMMPHHEKKHYVTIFMQAECIPQEDVGSDDGDKNDNNTKPSNLEPEKCEGWFSLCGKICENS